MFHFMLWRDNLWHYNTVALTSNRYFSFFWMQFIRLLLILCLFADFIVITFIFFKQTILYINWWSLFFTTIFSVNLFIGSGMEKCCQQQIEQRVKKEELLRSRLWMRGVFYYGLALPLVITSNIAYFSSHFDVRNDLFKITAVFFQKNYDPSIAAPNTFRDSLSEWRRFAILMSHLLPLIVVCFELLMNKIRIAGHHIIFCMLFTGFYFLICYVG